MVFCEYPAEIKNRTVMRTEKQHPDLMTEAEMTVDGPFLFDDVDEAVKACVKAQQVYKHMPMVIRYRIVATIRQSGLFYAEDLSLSAISETKRGRYDDKLTKTRLCCEETPGPEELNPKVFTGKKGICTIELGPYGVLCVVTPVTNPAATVLNNSMTILSGGNGIVFNPHPGARLVSNRAVAIVHDAIIAAGGPPNLIVSMRTPTIDSGVKLMTHPMIDGNLITGGPAVVKTALKSGKRSWCAGPGNPPVIVDETANLRLAADRILAGASFDNNMICSDEKEVFVVESVGQKLIDEMMKLDVYLLKGDELDRVISTCFDGNVPPDFTHGVINKDLVGKDASFILKKAGITVDPRIRLAICEVHEGHPLVWTEQLLPVLPIVRVPNFEYALKLAKRAEYNFKHTSSIYSNSMSNITQMANVMETSIMVANGSNSAGLASGGEGYVSFSIAGHTGEGFTRPSTFVRERRVVLPHVLSIQCE